MKLTDFEKFYKKQVSNQSSDLDTESLWDALEPQLEKPEKKRRFIFWIFGLGMLLFGSFVGYQFLKIETSAIEEITAFAEKKETNFSNSKEISNTPERIVQLEEKQLTNHIKITKKDTPNRIIEKQVVKNESSFLTKETATFGASSLSNSTNSIFEPIENKATETIAIESRLPISMLLPLISNNSALLDVDEQQVLDLPRIEVLKSKKDWCLLVGANFGYAKPYRTMTSKTQNTESFLVERKNSETGLEVLSSGIDFELKNQKNWSLIFGISANQLTERFDFENEFSMTGNVTDTTEITYRENGDILASQGTVVQTTDIYQLRKVYNTFRWLETKVGAGYVHQFGKFEVGLSGGALVGFGLKAKGIFLDTNGGYLDLKENGQSVYKKHPGLGLFSNLKLEYQISPKWSINSNLEIKNYQNSFTRADYPLSIKYRTGGLNLGVQYHLR